ncbi:MAG TPA: exodeoxyribonuclease VII small subunit [Gemmatimonadales bacterium]
MSKTGSPVPPSPGPSSLQADLARLEEIVRVLEQEDLDLDRALALFEEGIGRLREARRRLGDAEVRLKQLREGNDGNVHASDIG